MNSEDKKPISAQIPKALHKKLKMVALIREKTQNAVLVEALIRYLDDEVRKYNEGIRKSKVS